MHQQGAAITAVAGNPEPAPREPKPGAARFTSATDARTRLQDLLDGHTRDPAATATALLDRFGTLAAVLAADPDDLASVPGIDRAAARHLRALHDLIGFCLREKLAERPLIDNRAALERYLAQRLAWRPVEELHALFLDRKNRLLRHETLATGTVDHTPLYLREVVRRTLLLNASALILAHNHPSGDPTPSRHDIELTRELALALALFKIPLHDHIIIGHNALYSMRANQLL